MKIRAYIRLQKCTTSERCAFVQRSQNEHGIARGPINYYAVEGKSWAELRRTLKTFEVMGHSMLSADTACAFVKDIGHAETRLWKLQPEEVPAAARHENVRTRKAAPELTSFGVQAIEILDPNSQAAIQEAR